MLSSGRKSKEPPSRQVQAAVQELPVELWLYISELLSPQERVKLLGVNRLFYELAMDALYEKLSLVSPDTGALLDVLDTLRNPTISKRVRKLTIWPASMCEALYSDKSTRRNGRSVTKPANVFHKYLGKVYKGDSTCPASDPSDKYPSIEERRELFREGVFNLTQVKEVNIYIGKYASQVYLSSYILPFLQEVLWPSIRDTVRVLNVDAPNHWLEGFFPDTHDGLPTSLRYLGFKIQASSPFGGQERPKVSDALATLLKGLSEDDTLGELTLNTECADVWDPLDVVPSLKTLNIHNIPILPNPMESDMHYFLWRNPTIENLSYTIHSTTKAARLYKSTPSTKKGDCVGQPILSRLSSLTLSFDQRPSRRLDYLEYFASIGDNITRLSVNSPTLFSDLKQLLDAFASPASAVTPKLEVLHLTTPLLSPEMVKLIARKCPKLVELKFDINAMVGKDVYSINDEQNAHPVYDSKRLHKPHEFLAGLSNYAKSGIFREWSLRDLTIMEWEYGKGRAYNWETMTAVAALIPSIKSFVLQGHMRRDGLAELVPKFVLTDIGKRPEAWS
ncbi:hypothetical protein FA15DRAFT_616812 [Coprinopsis marcescibilis]|uniref:F-box domain-containing protein n=1 Tax=Coprinopsis marcescibilis TaxID=230819 RepID=A0A5C3KZV2_COPMA|nr:hypothetical protein FA15DRAFT_616812 [Coprinopsis marcescibilis]